MTEGFDYPALVDELSCRPTEWLQARRTELVLEQRRLRVEELAVVAVLDSRGALDTDSVAAADGVPARALRETVETARSLEELPAVAAAAYAGAVSNEQLVPLARLADPESDAEWARRAPHTAPADLAHLARTRTSPGAADAQRRREARHFRMWWSKDRGMFNVRGELPDVDGALVETTFTELIDRMRPVNGEAWASRDQRRADALVALCRSRRNRDEGGAVRSELPPVPVAKPLFVVEVPRYGPALVSGVPLPEAMVEALRAQANVEPVLVDDDGVPIARGRVFPALSPKVTRGVLLRDGRCRCGSCDRWHGLQVHHLWPRTCGGTDEISNLVAVCVGGGTDHHPMLVPHGPWLLLGNPNQPDGLRLVHHDSIPDLDDYIRRRRPPTLAELGLEPDHPGRAGPNAA